MRMSTNEVTLKYNGPAPTWLVWNFISSINGQ
jgi:hypothetical protein